MSLELYFHPLASFCHKVLIALYESDTPFEPHHLDLGDPAVRDELRALSPMGKMPVLRDHARGEVIAESTIIIEYLALYYPGAVALVPTDPSAALDARSEERFYDLYVHGAMQTIVLDRLRPPAQRDPLGVERAHALLQDAYAVLEQRMAGRTWATGDAFSLADCAAAPSLFYANEVAPFLATHPRLAAYFDRLRARPSYARVLDEARPWMQNFPR
jgi:glutathione S-transferase